MSFRPFVLVVLAAVACGSDPPPENPSTSAAANKPQDTTSVKMEPITAPSTAPTPDPTPSTPPPPAPVADPSDPSEDPNIGGPQEAVVEKAVAPVRPRLRACYKKALAADPKAAGSVTFDTTIGKDGKVASARFVKKDALSDDFVSCLTVAVKAMTFAPDRKSQVVAFSFGKTGPGEKAPSLAAPVASYGGPDAGPQKH